MSSKLGAIHISKLTSVNVKVEGAYWKNYGLKFRKDLREHPDEIKSDNLDEYLKRGFSDLLLEKPSPNQCMAIKAIFTKNNF